MGAYAQLLIALQKLNAPNVTNEEITEHLTGSFKEICDDFFEEIAKAGNVFGCIKYEDSQRI